MSCEKNRPRLQAYLDGILARDDEEGVERHLAGCEACRTEKERLEKVMEAVGGLTPLKAPAGFKEAFMERITQGQASEAPQREQPAFQRLRRMIPLSLAASFLIVGLTAYLVYFSQEGDGGRVPANGRPEDVAMKREGRGKKRMKTFDAEYALDNKQSTDGFHKGLNGSEAPVAEMVADRDKVEELKMLAEAVPAGQAAERLEKEESSKGIPDSSINTVLVMGSNSWSIPDALLSQAESRGIVVSGMAPGPMGPAGPATPGAVGLQSKSAIKGRRTRATETQQADKGERESVEAAKSGEEASSTLRNYLEEGIEWEYAVFEGDDETLKAMVAALKSSGPDAILGGSTTFRQDEVTDSIEDTMSLGKEESTEPGKLENPVVLFERMAGGRLEFMEQRDSEDPKESMRGNVSKRKSAEDDRDGDSDDVADLPEVGRWFAGVRFKAYDESPARSEEEKMNRRLIEAAAGSKAGERRKIILVYPKKRIAKEAEK